MAVITGNKSTKCSGINGIMVKIFYMQRDKKRPGFPGRNKNK